MTYGVNAPNGLQPLQSVVGGTWNEQTTQFIITAGYATSLFQGDPVAAQADCSIGIGTAGNTIRGVFWGCQYYDVNNNLVNSPYWPASTATYNSLPAIAFIIDDPWVKFNIQANATPGVVLADLNQNANFVAGAGSTITGASGYSLNVASINTTATLNLKILSFTPYPGNFAAAGYNNVVCLINNHEYKGGTGTLGV